LELIKALTVKCLVHKVFAEKRRGYIAATLAKHIDGLEEYAGEMSMVRNSYTLNPKP
jgi:hypothetical protein